MTSHIQLANYYLSSKTGFLLDQPKESLPEYFSPWGNLAKDMPELVSKRQLREAVMRMPLLDHTRLVGHREHRLAHLQLGVIITGFVWQDGPQKAPKVLPKCLAVPFYEVSRNLGLKPILSYCDLCLANWRYTDSEGNTDCLYNLPGGQEAMSFFRIAQRIEFEFAKGIGPLQCILDGVDAGNTVTVTSGLDAMAIVLKGMKSWLLKMHDHLTAHVFYNILRPFFEGWGHASSPLPDGLIYEGVSEEPIAALGITAAQNSGVALMDILLGVRHDPDKGRFLKEMRNYMPVSHRQLLEDLENTPRSLLHMVSAYRNEEPLQTAYNNCLKALTNFRSTHLQMAMKYIVVIARKNRRDEPNHTERGSGGSDIIPFLKDLRDDTKELISSKDQQTPKSL